MFKSIFLSLIAFNFLYSDNSIVVYNNGLSLFDVKSKLGNIKKGENNFIYENVSPDLIPNSVSIILPNNVYLLEQTFKYDLINQENILKFFIDKEVSYEKDNILKKCILIGIENENVIIKDSADNFIKVIPSKNIVVSYLPEGMTTKPSLVFKIFSEDNISNPDIYLRYLSNGFSWNSDYVGTIIEDELIFNGWITLVNNSDVSLEEYDLKLLAGDVNTVDKVQPLLFKSNSIEMSSVSSSPVLNKEISGYQIYKIPFKVNIDKKSTKQINFLNVKTKSFEKYNEISLYSDSNDSRFDQFISFKNIKENGLGEALPNGTVRLYEKDVDLSSYFIGEDHIDNIPKDESVKIKLGKNFNSLLSFKTVDSFVSDKHSSFSFNYFIRNNGEKNEKYIINQSIPIFNTLQDKISINSKSCSNNKKCSYKQISDTLIQYTINLNPKEKYSFDMVFSSVK